MLAADTPLVLVLEDLQWSDSATVELLAYLGQHLEPGQLLVLGMIARVDTMLRAHPRGARCKSCVDGGRLWS